MLLRLIRLLGRRRLLAWAAFEKSIKPTSVVVAKICTLLKLDLLEDIDACAKFVDGVIGVVFQSSFAKYTTKYRKTALLAMM